MLVRLQFKRTYGKKSRRRLMGSCGARGCAPCREVAGGRAPVIELGLITAG